MVYSTSRCPKCGKVIKRQTNPVHEVGSPFERRIYCGNLYLNSYKEEWITKSPIKRVFFFLQIYVWARAFLMPMLLVGLPLVALDGDVSLLKVLWPVMSVAWLVIGYFVHKKVNREDIEASLSRTENAEYIELLKKAGYKIYPVNNSTTAYHKKYMICVFDSETKNLRKETREIDTIKFPPLKYAVNDTYYAIETTRDGKKVRIYYEKNNWDKQIENCL